MKSESQYLVDAIKLLKPTSEFVLSNSDYSTIEWHVLDGDAPTQAEINAAIEQVKANDIADKETKANEKAALLARLNITAEEATLLLS
jgi:hypothetical protein